MRETLFRGKRVDNSKWIEGSLVVIGSYSYIFIDTQPSRIKSQSTKIYRAIIECVEVITETVGQYTGLTDKNGNKIFECTAVVWH